MTKHGVKSMSPIMISRSTKAEIRSIQTSVKRSTGKAISTGDLVERALLFTKQNAEKVFSVDREQGSITFGNGQTGRQPQSDRSRLENRRGGGSKGNVGRGSFLGRIFSPIFRSQIRLSATARKTLDEIANKLNPGSEEEEDDKVYVLKRAINYTKTNIEIAKTYLLDE